MAVSLEILDQQQALSAGSEIWVIAESSGPRFERLNWLSHFMLSRSLGHKMPQLSSQVLEILNQTELSKYDFIDHSGVQSHLIETSRAFPNQWVLLEDWSHDSIPVTTRARHILQKTFGLKTPHIRVFLPESLSASEVGKIFKSEFTLARSAQELSDDFDCKIQIVEGKRDSQWL